MNPHDPRLAAHLKLFQGLSMQDAGRVRNALEAGANPNEEDGSGQLALTYCAATWETPTLLSIMQLLHEKGANLEASNRNGRTPLMEAARSGRPLNAQRLLDMGANPHARCNNASSRRGWTALLFALEADNFDIATMLVKHGGWDSHYRTGDGKSLDEVFELHLRLSGDADAHRQRMDEAICEHASRVLQQKTPAATGGFGMRRM